MQELPAGSAGGLGFYYGDVNLDYVFHHNAGEQGEDLNFVREQGMPLHFAKIGLGQEKNMVIR
jgi:hypothetical protein